MRRLLPVILIVVASLAVARVAVAGPYADGVHGVNYNDPRFTGWATGVTVTWPSGFTPTYNNPDLALGAAPGTSNDVVTLGDCGTAVLTFSQPIRNGPGPDLAIFENGFYPSYAPNTLFAELAYVDVSSDGVNYVRFPSVSLNPDPGEYGAVDPTNIYNLAGKNVNNNDQAWQGTPFDLSDLKNFAAVKSGLVDLKNIRYVRIVDIMGGATSSSYDNATALIDPTTGLKYTTNHVIHDGGNNALGLTGFDLDAVGILSALTGDANGDGKVDGADLAIWQKNYDPMGLNAATNDPSDGDFNWDGKVDQADLLLWEENYNPVGIGSLSQSSLSSSVASVPEPGTLALLSAALAAGALRCRRSARSR